MRSEPQTDCRHENPRTGGYLSRVLTSSSSFKTHLPESLATEECVMKMGPRRHISYPHKISGSDPVRDTFKPDVLQFHLAFFFTKKKGKLFWRFIGHGLTSIKLPFFTHPFLKMSQNQTSGITVENLEFTFAIRRMTFLETTTSAYAMTIISNTYPRYIMAYTLNSATTFVVWSNTTFLDNVVALRRSSLSGCLIAFHTSMTCVARSRWGPVKAYSDRSRAASTVCRGMFQSRTYARERRVFP